MCRCCIPVVGIDFQTIDTPIRTLKRLRMILHIILTRRRLSGASGILRPNRAGPVAAESGVEDDVVVFEVVVDRAAWAALERGCGVAPAGGVGVGARGAVWDAAAGEEPDVDGGAGPFHGIDTTLGVVEAVAEGSGATGFGTAASFALAVFVDHGAAAVGVHGHCVLCLVVDAFDDVDFAVVGPARTLRWCMLVIGDGELLAVILPVIQNAGQTPHADPGMCCRSSTTSPWVYCL